MVPLPLGNRPSSFFSSGFSERWSLQNKLHWCLSLRLVTIISICSYEVPKVSKESHILKTRFTQVFTHLILSSISQLPSLFGADEAGEGLECFMEGLSQFKFRPSIYPVLSLFIPHAAHFSTCGIFCRRSLKCLSVLV